MQPRLQVEGLRELDAQLTNLEKRVAVRVTRAAIRKAAQPMLAEAKRLVPYDLNDPDGPDGYHLRDYMRLQLEPKRTRRSEAQYRLGPARLKTDEGGRAIAGGLGRSAKAPNYAGIIERKSPFLRPAFDNHWRGFIDAFKKDLAKRIERALR